MGTIYAKRYGIHCIMKQLSKLNSLVQECKMKINRYWIFELDCNGKGSFQCNSLTWDDLNYLMDTILLLVKHFVAYLSLFTINMISNVSTRNFTLLVFYLFYDTYRQESFCPVRI